MLQHPMEGDYVDPLCTNYMSQEGKLSLVKEAFLELDNQVVFPENVQDLPEMFVMFLF